MLLKKSFGNLPYSTQSDDLGQLMSSVGQVTNVRLVYDRQTNRPKGFAFCFAFCEFADQNGAQNAVNNLNGTDFNGRVLRVNWANK
uniref:RRM domain-containing protein n=1 Tax=Panagrolaimus sp. ES5 TaxID=591445 RepID=A0AC34GCB8_9BILA